MANVARKPKLMALLWAALKIDYENVISQFIACNSWSYLEFAKISEIAGITEVYKWIMPGCGIGHQGRLEAQEHAKKVQRIIIQTAKECWLPRCEIIEDDLPIPIPSNNPIHLRETGPAFAKAASKRRLAGFYLLWTMFWNQPFIELRQFVGIKINAYDITTMKKFFRNLDKIKVHVEDFDKRRLFKRVRFMFAQLKFKRAFDICVVPESLNAEDHVYLNTKYSGKVEKLDWEKSLKERMLFHPFVEGAARTAYRTERCIKEELPDLVTPEKVPRLIEALFHADSSITSKERFPNSNVHDVVNSLLKPSKYVMPDTSKDLSNYDSQPWNLEADGTTQRLKNLLSDFVLTCPYTMKNLLSEEMYLKLRKIEKRAKLAEIRSTNPKNAKIRDTMSKQDLKSLHKAFFTQRPKMDIRNLDNMKPVLKALGLPEEPKEMDADMLKYLTKVTNLPQQCASKTTTLRFPPEYEFLFINHRDELETQLRKCREKLINILKAKEEQTKKHNVVMVKQEMNVKGEGKVSTSDDDGLDSDTESEHVSSPEVEQKYRIDPIDEATHIETFTNPERIFQDLELSDDDEENIDRIIESLTNIPTPLSPY